MQKVLLTIEWFWINFSSGFYTFQNALRFWKSLMFHNHHDKEATDIILWLFWARLSGR